MDTPERWVTGWFASFYGRQTTFQARPLPARFPEARSRNDAAAPSVVDRTASHGAPLPPYLPHAAAYPPSHPIRSNPAALARSSAVPFINISPSTPHDRASPFSQLACSVALP
jgi:hypothetical protein